MWHMCGDRSPSLRESMAGTQAGQESGGQNWGKAHGRELLPGLLLWLVQKHPRRDGTFHSGLGPSHQPSLKKTTHRLTYRPT